MMISIMVTINIHREHVFLIQLIFTADQQKVSGYIVAASDAQMLKLYPEKRKNSDKRSRCQCQ